MTYRNLAEMHRRQTKRLGPRAALRFKRHGLYRDLCWDDYRAQALAAAAALIDIGMEPGDRVGLLAENRVEWLVADMAILTAAAVNVPPHAPLTPKQIHFQLHDAGARWLIVSTRAQFDKVRQIRRELPDLRGVVLMDGEAPADGAVSWRSFLQRGWRRCRDWPTSCAAGKSGSAWTTWPRSCTPPGPRAIPRASCSRTATC